MHPKIPTPALFQCLFQVALCQLVLPALGSTPRMLDLDVTDDPGVVAGIGGTWDMNQTLLWRTDPESPRTAWANHDDLARVQLDTAYTWGDVTLTVDNSHGAVGAAGLHLVGDLTDWKKIIITGDPLRLGAEGFLYRALNPTVYTYFASPVVLTASQTWRSSNARNIDGGGTVQINGVLSSTEGITTDLTFDGMGRSDPGLTGAFDEPRPGFRLLADNTFSGSTTIRNGAFAWLQYTASPGSKLDASSPLLLRGGGLWMNGGSGIIQAVSETRVETGFNVIRGRNGNGAFHCSALIRTGLGGTIDFPVNWAGGIDAFTTTTNQSGILGGWATHNEQTFARAGTDGENTIINGLSGTQRGSPDLWGSGENIRATGGGVRNSGDVTIHSLRLDTSASIDLGSATVTVASGGILSQHASGSHLTGGALRSGMESGELFVHAYRDLQIDSPLEDQPGSPLVLVKGGRNRLTLSSAPQYSGGTYLNAGTLELADQACIRAPLVQSGGTTLALRDGGVIEPAVPGTMDLHGNLTLASDAVVKLRIGVHHETLALQNPFSTLRGPDGTGTIHLHLLDGTEIARASYPLIQWAEGVTLSGLDLDDFDVVFPDGVDGELQFDGQALVVHVTAIPATGTLLLVR